MKYLWFSLLFFLAVPCLIAERPVITPEISVTTSLLLQWLHSGNPRLVAWASYFAHEKHDTTVIEEMPALLEHCANIPPITDDTQPQSDERRAAIAVLDTLIQENVQVPIPAIKAIAKSFPAQAVILISRLPLNTSRITLNDWTYYQQGSASELILARIATMILAKDPQSMRAHESSLASRIVASSEEELYIHVTSNISYQGKGGPISFLCGVDSFISETTQGWPHIYTYDLVENDSLSIKRTVVDLKDDRITFRRFEKLESGNCGFSQVNELNPWTRHYLLAYWLGVKEDRMLWQPVESFSIIWTDYSSYQRQLGEIVETQREKLQATVEALHKRGILTESQATTLPKLIVTIKCDIKPCPLN